MADPGAHQWTFYRFGLIVTGRGEEAFLPVLFRSLAATGRCHFQVIGRTAQLSPRTSAKKKFKTRGRLWGSRDEEIGLLARGFLRAGNSRFVILIDDLEADRGGIADAVFKRYRTALDTLLEPEGLTSRAAVHFFANMLEAYYFADASALNSVFGTDFVDEAGDVEDIPHPKNELKRRIEGFDETRHGRLIVEQLDARHVLSRRETCAALRALFAWCWKALRSEPTDEFQLAQGAYLLVTGPQIRNLEQ